MFKIINKLLTLKNIISSVYIAYNLIFYVYNCAIKIEIIVSNLIFFFISILINII